MDRSSRLGAIAFFVMTLLLVGAGVWLQATGGGAVATGFLQYSAVAVGAGALSGFVLWHRPAHRYGLAHGAVGVLFGTVVLAAGVLSRGGTAAAPPGWAQEVALAWSWLAAAALLPLWVVVIAAFPTGRFHRPILGRATVVLAIVMPILAMIAYLLAPAGSALPLVQVSLPPGLTGPLAHGVDAPSAFRAASAAASALGALAPVAAVLALLDRFRTGGPVVRQQVKWLLMGTATSVVLQAVQLLPLDSDALGTAVQVVVLLAVPLPMLAAGIAIAKHGLWEIDLVISRTLVYVVTSAVLTGSFLAVALVAGVTVGGRDSRVVAALALALLVSFLTQPLRQRLEGGVARLLYGDEPRGIMALAQLRDLAGPAADSSEVGARITDAVRGALGAGWAGVWLFTPGDGRGTLRCLSVQGLAAAPSAVLPRDATRGLTALSGGRLMAAVPDHVGTALRPLFPDAPAAVAALTSGGSLIGLIACGSRPRAPFTAEDVELLAVAAHEAALVLQNIRLEEELREQLDQIEQQAAELQCSRQRLVTAQNEERRRIERDLHDGAQQQLVALAAGLRRAARAGDGPRDRTVDELADQAEEAVFTLQELARGIYPSLLADLGLQAALQAHASRLPEEVRIEVEPHLHGRRLDPELEAALYFVGLEAMTNAVKHAPGAHVLVSLRTDDDERAVVLEVHDDGPGLADRTGYEQGSGLQNMADRMDALGGTFSVESVPGRGTWVRAGVRPEAKVTELRSRAATP